ncbi:MAG: hypothetical protein U0414_23660 [Polyangiaceae bacterium]
MAKAPSAVRAANAPSSSPDDPAPAPGASELSAFVRDAIREKAKRDLAALDTRAKAIEAATKARGDIQALIEAITEASPALAAGADVTAGVPAKLKRLRKALDEASSTAEQIAEAIGADSAEGVQEKRSEIEEALRAAGIAREELASN